VKEQVFHYLEQQEYSNDDLLGHVKKPIGTPSERFKLGHCGATLYPSCRLG
jgi:hypothetical protein